MSYLRYGAMIAMSTVAMFVLMYLNTYVWSHVFFSETRVYMALLMGAAMAVIMLSFMLAMYRNTMLNAAIYAVSVAVFVLALWLVRSQTTVGDVSYMRAMIPHHSIAIMTSERADIDDPRVRKLADEIIAAQRREIAEMRYLVASLEGDPDAVPPGWTGQTGQTPEVAPLSEALDDTVIATLDPRTLDPADVEATLAPNPGCTFRRTVHSEPILVARGPVDGAAAAEGVMKLSGTLVRLRSRSTAGFEALVDGPAMRAEGVTMTVRPAPGARAERRQGRRVWPADLVFELDRRLTVGYRGVYACDVT